jgi:DNA replication and repair protein RecF
MYLEKLSLENFKNYERSALNFSPFINVITGKNGSGKTNLLDAIYFLSLTKSAFSSNDQLNIRKGESFFRIEGNFIKDNKSFLVEAAFSGSSKKIIKVDKMLCEKVKDHVGRFPVILMTPYDTDVIREGSEERRKFFDSVFSQSDKSYLSELIKYGQILKQRNALLKDFFEKNYVNQELLNVYDKQLLESGYFIYEFRKKFTRELVPFFNQYYQKLTEGNENVKVEYQSQLSENDFDQSLKNSLRSDIVSQRTSRGIHKDDFYFEINDLPLKNFGSQGQQKSFVISLKLAQYQLLEKANGEKPIILLDDIFDKLDESRIAKLMNLVSGEEFGQIFITDARVKRTLTLFEDLKTKILIFEVENGTLKEKSI